MALSITQLPFNRLVGLQPASQPEKLLALPAGEQYLNHLGTVHASAQLALAEASSGEFLVRTLGDNAGLIPVVRRLEAKFRKPAKGSVTSTARIEPSTLDQFRGELTNRGRAMVAVTIDLHDESGTHVLTATIEWFIQKTD